MVSHWYHATYHYQEAVGSLTAFLRSDCHGIAAYLRYLEGWGSVVSRSDGRLIELVTYEALRDRTLGEFMRVLGALALEVNEELALLSVEDAEFSRMQRLEIEHGIKGIDYDRSNPRARRVRDGRFGSFLQHLSEADLQYINCAIEESAFPARHLLEASGLLPLS